MNRSSTIRLTLSVFGALIPTSGLLAQAATPATKEEAIVLAPFTVSVEGSNGYKVSTATTATRTNTALIDIPQTVDVITKEFWNDVGATTFDQSFRYVANTYVRNRMRAQGTGSTCAASKPMGPFPWTACVWGATTVIFRPMNGWRSSKGRRPRSRAARAVPVC